jgi:endoglycosylceramidase
MSRATLLLAGLICVVVALDAAAAPAGAARPLSSAGRWIKDHDGRVRILRGVAVMDFARPHLPEAVGFGEDDARFLEEHGFDVVRLGFNWEGAEPQPGVIDHAYLDSLMRTVRILGRHGIYSLLDAHQDGYGPLVGTDGAPDWAVRTDGAPNNRVAFGVDYFANPALLRAFDNLYANAPAPDGKGLADHFAGVWAAIARSARAEPHLLGYEILNEPYPGSQYATCTNPAGCPAFDATLSAFYRRVTSAVRAVDGAHLIFYEPNLFFDFGANTHLDDPSGGRPQAGFAFHNYCLGGGAGDALPPVPGSEPGCSVEEQMVFDNGIAYGTRARQPLIVTEWAATDDLGITRRMTDELDSNRLPWTFWQYNSKRLVRDPKKPPAGENLNASALDVIDRPHPASVAGTPEGWHWDEQARMFTLRYVPGATGLTEVWAGRQHYPRGYRVELRGGTLASEASAPTLRIRTSRGAGAVDVRVLPGSPRSCFDRAQPRSRVDRRRSRVSRRGARLRGRAADAGCAGSADVHPVFGRVRRVRVAVYRRRGKICRFLSRRGRLTRPRRCRRPVWLRARGAARWRLRVRAHLPRGRYRVRSQAVDLRGNSERRRTRRNSIRARVR